MLYIPVNTILREECEELHEKSVPFDLVHHDYVDDSEETISFTEMREACKRGNSKCDYILKVSTYHHKEGTPLKKYFMRWHTEATVFSKLNKYHEEISVKLAPYLYKSWYIQKGGVVHFYLLMERFDGDLVSLVGESGLAYRTAMERMDCYLALIHRYCNVILNDFNLKDMLYKEIGHMNYHFVFSEFGSATEFRDREYVKDREKFHAAYLLHKE
jgi:hypothetical protein